MPSTVWSGSVTFTANSGEATTVAVPMPHRGVLKGYSLVEASSGATGNFTAALYSSKQDKAPNNALPADSGVKAYSHLLGESELGLFGIASLARKLRRGFPQSIDGAPMLLPTEKSPNRRSLEGWFEAQQIRPSIAAELDDSALVKTFAQQGVGVFAAPLAIEREIVHAYGVQRIGKVEGLKARFYVLSTERRIKHPAVAIIREQAQVGLFNRDTV